jgi:hypothetical protein
VCSVDPNWWTIYAGDVDLEGNGVMYNASFFIEYEYYEPTLQFLNDIALIRVRI